MKNPFAREDGADELASEDTIELPREVAMLTTAMVREVSDVQARLDALHDKFDARLRDDHAREQLFNQLYDDMQARRREQLDDHLLPLVRSVLLVIDRVDARDAGSPGVEEQFATLRDELLDGLHTVGVEPIELAPDLRDSRLQRVVETVPSCDGAWVERKPGYVMGTRVIRPQQIAVPADVDAGAPE